MTQGSLLQYPVLWGAAFDPLSKKELCFLLWDLLFSSRVLLFPQVLTHVLLQQPGWKWWYSAGRAWVSIQTPFSLNYSSRTQSWSSAGSLCSTCSCLSHFSKGWSAFLSARAEMFLLSRQISSGDRDIGKGHWRSILCLEKSLGEFCPWLLKDQQTNLYFSKSKQDKNGPQLCHFIPALVGLDQLNSTISQAPFLLWWHLSHLPLLSVIRITGHHSPFWCFRISSLRTPRCSQLKLWLNCQKRERESYFDFCHLALLTSLFIHLLR